MSNATLRTQNIKRTVQEYLDGAGMGVPLLYDDTQKPLPEDGSWIDVRWGPLNRTDMAGAQKAARWNLYLDCWSRLKDDPMGAVLDGLADKALDKCRDRRIPLNDYTDPALPVATGFFVRLSIDGDDYLPPTDLVRGRALTIEVSYFERP